MPAAELSPRLELLYFKLFDDCNVKCNMCACWEQPRTRRDTQYYKDSLDRLLRLRPNAVRFTGGEPLLLPGLPELVCHAASMGTRVSVITNGRLLRTKAVRLAEAGCTEIVLSLDGVGTTHDVIRRTSGLFQRCLKGIEALAAAGMEYGVNTVVQHAGVSDLPSLADVLLQQPAQPRWWHLIPVRDCDELVPTAAEQKTLRELLPSLRTRLAAHGVTLMADDQMFAQEHSRPCHVPEFTAYAGADTGELFGCNMLSHRDLSLGSYVDAPADSTWLSDAANTLRDQCRRGLNSPCQNCDRASQGMNHLLRALAANRPTSGR